MSDYGVNVESSQGESLLGGHPPVEIPVTILSGQNLKRGHVLGKVTASGKYAGYDNDLADGREVARAILAVDTDASSGDTPSIAYVHGEFRKDALSWDDPANDIDAGVADLFAAGIFVK